MTPKTLYEVTDSSTSEHMATMLSALQNENIDFDPSKVCIQDMKASVEFDFQKQEIRTKFYQND